MSNPLTPTPPSPEREPRSIDGIAGSEILRGPWWRLFTKDRYIVTLDIDGVDTGLHWHASTKKQAKHLSTWATENAADILLVYGLTNKIIAKVEAARYNLPEVGATIRLTQPLSERFPKGTEGSVTRVEWDEADEAENRYPVLVTLADRQGQTSIGPIPLSLSEFEVVSE